MRMPGDTITTIDLDHDQLLIFDGGRDARVRVLHGGAWLTQEGAADDAFVPAGGELALGAGRAVLSAIGAARVQRLERRGSRLARVAAWLARQARRLRQQIVRWQLGPVGDACRG